MFSYVFSKVFVFFIFVQTKHKIVFISQFTDNLKDKHRYKLTQNIILYIIYIYFGFNLFIQMKYKCIETYISFNK